MYHPEMSRALAEQQVRDLHRAAAHLRAARRPPSPVAQHWAVLAVRLHLRRAATLTPPRRVRLRPGRPGRRALRVLPRRPRRPGPPRRGSRWAASRDRSSPGAVVASMRLDTVVVDCPDPAALARFYAALLGRQVDPGGDARGRASPRTGRG